MTHKRKQYYEDYDGPLGTVIGICSEKRKGNGGILYIVECAYCGENHVRDAKHLKQNMRSRECKHTRSSNWSGLDRWDAIIRRTYGITLEEYYELIDFQGGGCAICGKALEKNGRRLSIDHDHQTGRVRGVLCSPCNQGLGQFKDNVESLEMAIEYLKSNPYKQYSNAR